MSDDEMSRRVRALPEEERRHIQHVLRDGLQAISCMVELERYEDVKLYMDELAGKLNRMGL